MKLNIITYLIQQFPGHIRTFINENYCHIICIYIYINIWIKMLNK